MKYPSTIEFYWSEWSGVPLSGRWFDSKKLVDRKEVVVPAKFIIKVDYPLKNVAEFKFDHKNPLTRGQLASEMIKLYKHIYDEEDRSIKKDPAKPCFNICGHDIYDLMLNSVDLVEKRGAYRVYSLSVDS